LFHLQQKDNFPKMQRRHFIHFAALVASGRPAESHSYMLSNLLIGHAWALPSSLAEGQAFMPILNKGPKIEKLLSARMDFAATVELRRNNRYSDPPEQAFQLEPNRPLPMRPTGFHLRLIGLQRPLRISDHFNLVLDFELAGETSVEVYVETAPGD
jgi:periplasmic copper chaperone A